MVLKLGSVGDGVRQLQAQLNALPGSALRLVEDGQFGQLTRNRVVDVQRSNGLVQDGEVGPLTLALIAELLGRFLPPTPPAPPPAVRSINQEILGQNGPDNLIQQIFPSIMAISPATFRPNTPTNRFLFQPVPLTVGRLGIFAAQKGGVERAVILVLPLEATPTRLNICITQGFGQGPQEAGPTGLARSFEARLRTFCLVEARC